MGKLLLKLFVKDYKNTKDEKVRKKYGLIASFFGLITNFILFAFKIVLGLILNMFSLVSDSLNNLSDFANNTLSFFGVKFTYKPADKNHPYGHQRSEYIISLFIGVVIFSLGAILLYQAVLDLVAFINSIQKTGEPEKSSLSSAYFIITLIVLSFAIILKVSQSLIYSSYGKAISSMQLKALAKDSLNDCISTSLIIVGLVFTYLTEYKVDCFFSIVVSILVIYSSISIIKDASNILLGEKPNKEVVESLVNLITFNKNVLGVHDLEIHSYGKMLYAVIHVEVDAKKDVMLSHEMCDELEKEVLNKLNIHLTIHMDPIYIDDPDTNKYKHLVEQFIEKENKGYHFHDFRILSGEKRVNLIFDMVIPYEIDNEETRKNIKNDLLEFIADRYGKKVYLILNFDSAITDLLSSDIEKSDI